MNNEDKTTEFFLELRKMMLSHHEQFASKKQKDRQKENEFLIECLEKLLKDLKK